MNKRETKSPRKVWTVQQRLPADSVVIGWIALDQAATATVPFGAPLAFAYADVSRKNSDELEDAERRFLCLHEFAAQGGSPDCLDPCLCDLRHVGRSDHRFPIPSWLLGVLLSEVQEGDYCAGPDRHSEEMIYFTPDTYPHIASPAMAIGATPIDAPVDMNGVPIYPGDLIFTDCEDIGRVRDVAGNGDAGRAGVTYDLLIDSGDMDLPKPGAGMSWITSQLVVFLRADGSRPVKPDPATGDKEKKATAS